MRIAWSPRFYHELPEGHRFPMEKYQLLPEQLMHEGIAERNQFFVPEPMPMEVIAAVHDAEYLEKLQYNTLSKLEIRAIGFPFGPSFYERELEIMFGSVQASLYAVEDGIGFNIAGGTHHAYRDHGEGFCILNDLAVAAQYLLDHGHAKQVLVVDLDVHQGNGTAGIFADEPRVFTFSMHGANNYPPRKEQSDLDIALHNGMGDEEYLEILSNNLQEIGVKLPDVDFVLYQCGVDVLATDKLGKLGLSMSGIAQRDKMVLDFAYKHGIPLMACMGGGYSEQIKDIILAHTQVYRIGREYYN